MVLTLVQTQEFAQHIALSNLDRIRHVKTPEGAKFFGLPIGSPIPQSKMHPHIRSVAQLNEFSVGTRINVAGGANGFTFEKVNDFHWKNIKNNVVNTVGVLSSFVAKGKVTLATLSGESGGTKYKPEPDKITVVDLVNAPTGSQISVHHTTDNTTLHYTKDENGNWISGNKKLHSVAFKANLDRGDVKFIPVKTGQMKPFEAGSLKKLGEVLQAAKKDMSKKFEVLADPGESGDAYYAPGLWGKYGAAGVLVRHMDEYGNEKFLLVQRGPGVSSNVGKWQLPGGALDSKENPYQGVARETVEELQAPKEFLDGLVPVNENVFEKDGWTYTNITADSSTMFEPVVDGSETGAAGWFTRDEIKELELHPALAKNMDVLIGSFPKPVVKNWEDALFDIPKIQNDIKEIQTLLEPVPEVVPKKHYSVPDLIAMPVGTTIKGTPDGQKHYTLIKNSVGMWAVSVTPIDHMHGQNTKNAWVWSLLGNTKFGDWEVRQPVPEKPKLLVMSVKELDLAGVGTKITNGMFIFEKKNDTNWHTEGYIYNSGNFEAEIENGDLSFVTEDSPILPVVGEHFTSLEQFNSLPLGAVVGWDLIPEHTWKKATYDKNGWIVLPSGVSGVSATPSAGKVANTFLVSLPEESDHPALDKILDLGPKKSYSALYNESGYIEGLPDGTVLVQKFAMGLHKGDKVHWLKKDGKWWRLDKEGKITSGGTGFASSVLAQPSIVIVDMFQQDLGKPKFYSLDLKVGDKPTLYGQLDQLSVGSILTAKLGPDWIKQATGSWKSNSSGMTLGSSSLNLDVLTVKYIPSQSEFTGFVKSKKQLDAAPVGTVVESGGLGLYMEDSYTKLENGNWLSKKDGEEWENEYGKWWTDQYFTNNWLQFADTTSVTVTTQKTISVNVQDHKFSVPAGSFVYVSNWTGFDNLKYVAYPDNTWHQISSEGIDTKLDAHGGTLAAELISSGEIVLDTSVEGNTSLDVATLEVIPSVSKTIVIGGLTLTKQQAEEALIALKAKEYAFFSALPTDSPLYQYFGIGTVTAVAKTLGLPKNSGASTVNAFIQKKLSEALGIQEGGPPALLVPEKKIVPHPSGLAPGKYSVKPTSSVYMMIYENGTAAYFDKTGTSTSLTPKAVAAKTKLGLTYYHGPSSVSAPGTGQAAVAGPVSFTGNKGTQTFEAPAGSKVYHIKGKTSETAFSKTVQKSNGTWAKLIKNEETNQWELIDQPTSFGELYAKQVAAGVLVLDKGVKTKKIAVKNVEGSFPFVSKVPSTFNNLGLNELSSIIVKMAEESGYKNIAGLNRVGMTKSQRIEWIKAWYNGEFDKAYAIELSAAGKTDKDAQIKSIEELTNAPIGSVVRLYSGKGYYEYTKWYDNSWATYDTHYGHSDSYMSQNIGDLVWPNKIHHAKATQHPGSLDNPVNASGFKKVNFGPAVAGEVPAGTAIDVPEPYKTKFQGDLYYLNKEDINVYMLAAGMQNAQGLGMYDKKNWVKFHIEGNKLQTDALSLQAQRNVKYGSLYSEVITPPKPVIGAQEAVTVSGIIKTFNTGSSHAVNLTDAQTEEYIRQLFTTSTSPLVIKQSSDVQKAIVQLHWLTTVPTTKGAYKTQEQAVEEFNALRASIELQAAAQGVSSLSLPPVKKVTAWKKSPNKGNYKGAFEKYRVMDDTETEFFFKPAKENWRSDIANSAHAAGRLFGYTPAWSNTITVDGVYGQVQSLIPSKEDLGPAMSPVSPKNLTSMQMIDVLKEHVFDWAVGQDDSHAENFMVLPNGHLIGIDKDRSWYNVDGNINDSHNMQLSLDGPWKGPYIVEPSYYGFIYDAITNGEIDPNLVRSGYKAALAKARFIERASDEKYLAILQDGPLKNPSLSDTQKAMLVEQVMSRKHNLVADFEAFWDSIFQKSGIERPVPSQFPDVPGLHTGFTSELIEPIKKARNYGHATFFAGEDLEDGHFIAWEETGKGVVVHRDAGSVVESTDINKVPIGTVISINNSDTFTKISDTVWHDSDGNIEYNPSDIVSEMDNFNGATYVNDVSFLLVGGVPDTFMAQAQLRENADQKMMAWLNQNYKGGVGAVENDVSLTGLMGQSGYAALVKKGHRTVEYHISKNDFAYNQDSLAAMEDARKQMQTELDSGSYESFYPDSPHMVAAHKDMLEHYLNIIANVNTAKAESLAPAGFVYYKFAPKPNEVTALKPKYTVSKKDPVLHTAELDADTNMLYATDGESSDGQSGSEYVIDLEDGTQIFYRPWADTEMSQKGLLKIRKVDYHDNIDHASRAIEFLREVGIPLEEATDEDLELLYWRMAYGVLTERGDKNTEPQNQVVNSYKADSPKNRLDKSSELDRWHEVWSQLQGPEAVDSWVASAGYLPRFEHAQIHDIENVHGRPYWLRFDVDVNWLRLTKQFLSRSQYNLGGDNYDYHSDNVDSALMTAIKSGASIPGEERARVVGHWINGTGSPTSDQSNGSSMFNMVRQNIEKESYHIYYDPALLARLHTYTLGEDSYGNIENKKSKSYWNINSATNYHSGGNEVPVKYGLNIPDHAMLVVFATEKSRKEAIQFYLDLGITQLANGPVEEVFVTNDHRKAALKAAHDRLKARVEAGPEYVPPVSKYVPGDKIVEFKPSVVSSIYAKKISSWHDLDIAPLGTEIQAIGDPSNVLAKTMEANEDHASYWTYQAPYSGSYESIELIPEGEIPTYEFVLPGTGSTNVKIGQNPTGTVELDSMPAGTVLKSYMSGVWTKQDDGTWTGNVAGPDHSSSDIVLHYYQYTYIPEAQPAGFEPLTDVTEITWSHLPIGAQIIQINPEGNKTFIIKKEMELWGWTGSDGTTTWNTSQQGAINAISAGLKSPESWIYQINKNAPVSVSPEIFATEVHSGVKVTSHTEMDSAPIGSQVIFDFKDTSAHDKEPYVKQENEWLAKNGNTYPSKEFGVDSGHLYWVTVPSNTPQKFTYIGTIQSYDQMDAAPMGAQFTNSEGNIWTKKENGKWAFSGSDHVSEIETQSILDTNFKNLTWVQQSKLFELTGLSLTYEQLVDVLEKVKNAVPGFIGKALANTPLAGIIPSLHLKIIDSFGSNLSLTEIKNEFIKFLENELKFVKKTGQITTIKELNDASVGTELIKKYASGLRRTFVKLDNGNWKKIKVDVDQSVTLTASGLLSSGGSLEWA